MRKGFGRNDTVSLTLMPSWCQVQGLYATVSQSLYGANHRTHTREVHGLGLCKTSHRIFVRKVRRRSNRLHSQQPFRPLHIPRNQTAFPAMAFQIPASPHSERQVGDSMGTAGKLPPDQNRIESLLSRFPRQSHYSYSHHTENGSYSK